MNIYSRDRRKIDPTRVRPDGTPDDDDRIEIGPTKLAFDEWAEAGLVAPNLEAMRLWRLERLRGAIAERGLAGLLVTDPLNIRYATDATNMQIWNMHNPFRACLVCADGHMVLWEYSKAMFLAAHYPLVCEVRPGKSLFYFTTGDRAEAVAAEFAGEVAEILAEHSPGEKHIAIDKIMVHGLKAIEALGFVATEGEELTEKARSIKGPDDLLAMRCAIHTCEASMAAMEAAATPGMTEVELWSVMYAENLKRGGEWLETRLLASGPRTNPWFQECGPRHIRNNEIIAYDTDMVGPYGMCSDMSRTFWLGDADPRPDMIEDYRLGWEHIDYNMSLLKPGASIRDLCRSIHTLPPMYQKQKYSCWAHGVGLCDEWPFFDYPDHWNAGAFDYELVPGMCLCVEALISREGGDFSIKLEDQVVVTETGCENLSRFPRNARLLGRN